MKSCQIHWFFTGSVNFKVNFKHIQINVNFTKPMKTHRILQLLIYMINTGSNVLKTRFNEVRPMCWFFSTKVKFNRIRDAFLDSKMDLENSLQIAKNFNFSLSFLRFGEFTACLILMMYHHKRENIETTKPMKTQ